MPTPPIFRFYIMLNASTFIYVDDGGNIATTEDFAIGIANPLRYAPNNWQDVAQIWERSEEFHGIYTKLSNEYTFSKDGAKILRYIMFTYGYTSKAILRVDRLLSDGGAYLYTQFQSCSISFENVTADMETVTIQLFEDGIAQEFKTNQDTPVEVPIDGGLQVFFAGTRVKGSYNYRYGETSTMLPWPTSRGINNGWYFTMTIVNTNNEGFKPVAVAQDTLPFEMGSYASLKFNDDEANTKFLLGNIDTQNFATVLDQTETRIRWKYENGSGAPTVDAAFELFVIYGKPNENYTAFPVFTGPIRTLTSGTEVEEIIPPFNIPYSLPPSYNIYIVGGVFVDAGSPVPNGFFYSRVLNFEEVKLKITLDFNTAGSYVNGKRQGVLWKDSLVKLFDGKYGLDPVGFGFYDFIGSRLTDNIPYNTILCNALHLKGVNDAIFKVTIGDLWKHFKALYPVGVSVKNGQIVMSLLGDLYDSVTVIQDVGIFTNWNIEPTNQMGKILKFGYNFDEGDVVNGRDTTNTVSSFKSDGTFSSDKQLDFISPYIADIQSIEKQRVENAGKDTTGNKINDEIFCFTVLKDFAGVYILNYPNQLGGVVSGVLFPDWTYNVDLSPRRNAERNRFLISSICMPSTSPIVFQSSERNADMVSKFGDGGGGYYAEIKEKDPIVPKADEALWLPFKFKAECRTSADLPTMMKTNPYGVIKGKIILDSKTVEVRIFVDTISFKPATRDAYEIEGRLAPNVNLDDLK